MSANSWRYLYEYKAKRKDHLRVRKLHTQERQRLLGSVGAVGQNKTGIRSINHLRQKVVNNKCFVSGNRYKLGTVERGLHCFCVMARVRKVMRAATAKTEKSMPIAMKNLRPLSQVRQQSCRYMMCVTSAQNAKTPVERETHTHTHFHSVYFKTAYKLYPNNWSGVSY